MWTLFCSSQELARHLGAEDRQIISVEAYTMTTEGNDLSCEEPRSGSDTSEGVGIPSVIPMKDIDSFLSNCSQKKDTLSSISHLQWCHLHRYDEIPWCLNSEVTLIASPDLT